MTITDGQIALGIIQLVGLTLPVFAILGQLYYSMTEEAKDSSIGMTIMIGGAFLIIAAISSAQYLYSKSNSIFVGFSLSMISVGLVAIFPLLYSIYERTKKKLKRTSQYHLEHINRIIEYMEENEYQSVREIEDSNIEVGHIKNTKTLDELKSLKHVGEKAQKNLEKPVLLTIPKSWAIYFFIVMVINIILAKYSSMDFAAPVLFTSILAIVVFVFYILIKLEYIGTPIDSL